jgi:2-succinyl-6-hydroxy-2,4-cyclohexadiene-1-carboxylate synthase
MTRIATRDGVAYDVHDTGRGDVVVLLHGFAGDSHTWDPVRDRLGERRRLLMVDLLGHGGSDGPPAERHEVERQATDIAWLIDGLCQPPVDVVGYSLGARVALWLSSREPRLVHRLVLESPSTGIADPGRRAERVTTDEAWAALLERGDLAAFHEAWEAQPIFASRASLPAEARDALRARHLAASGHGLAASLRGAGQGTMSPLEDLGSVAARALVIAGALDPVGLGRASEVADLLPEANLEVVVDAGHAPHLERPEAFLRITDDFLSSDTRGAP